MKNKKTLYHFVIDQSGSMAGAEQATIAGFNTQLKTIQELKTEHPDEKYLCSLTLFNAEINDVIRYADVEKLSALNIETYQPNGATALLDAIGKSIFSIKEKFGKDISEDKMSVVLVIITDGHENCSRMYTYHDISMLIKNLDGTQKCIPHTC
jgi:Mg-chelatase subunit ChlD